MKKGKFRSKVLSGFILLVLLCIRLDALATHLRAGNITVQRVDCSGLTFKITITAYTNAGSPIIFSDHDMGVLDFGDGSPIVNPKSDAGKQVPGFPPEFHYVVYTTTHTYGGSGRFTISYFEHNRNAGILNMSGSVDTPFYIETVIDIDPLKGCDSSPILLTPPIDKGCTGVAWFHNPGAYDPDGDSLSYVLVEPKQTRLDNVNNYSDPNSASFYNLPGVSYNTANEAGTGKPIFKMDAITGLITWDAPGTTGQYNIAFHVIEWRKRNGVWLQLGYVTRDMQIIIEDCKKNHRPELQAPADLCVVAGTQIDEFIIGTDIDHDQIRLEAFSQIFSLSPSPATVTPDPPVFQALDVNGQAKLHFHWNTSCSSVQEQPYQVVFKVTDAPSSGPALVQFKTWNIRVVAPAPKWTSLQSLAGHRAQLTWESYECASSAQFMQIWRRVESNPYDPPACVTGMPDFLGFEKIAQVPIAITTYLDTNNGKGLTAGAQYCYRLVAAFPDPRGGLSYVSKEMCFTTKNDAPVITNVSISNTDLAQGIDTVKWIPPFKTDIDTVAFPPPYSYGVFRSEGFTPSTPYVQLTPGKTSATFFIDDELNTLDKIYNYRIVAYSGQTLIDSSASASSVRLEVRPHEKSIDLNWSATVPWSNILANHPLHYVYRGPEGSKKPSDMTLIAQVDVTTQKLHYLDSGQSDNVPLDKSKIYCYCVMTQGGYGNPKIQEPLKNFSQVICIQPNDNTPPCKVTLKATGTNCPEVFRSSCTPTAFTNTVTWNQPNQTCQAEAYRYNVYVADHTGESFSLYVTNVADTFFIDNNLASYARCYKISAISRSGVEGELSDPFCFDNCPNYELPNVFTPGLVDQCNDKFSAFSDAAHEGTQNPLCPLPTDILSHCARFVNSVNFTVYNRWGKEVFSYQSGGENSIYIDWDGRDDSGKELSTGVYYYLAQVNFNVVDPSKQNQTIKGWVQLVR